VAKFKYLGMTLTNKNDIHDEIKSRLNSGLPFSPKSFVFPSHVKKKKLEINIHKTVIMPVVLYECETWFLTLREEQRLRVSENSVLRRILGPEREEDRLWRKLQNDELHNLYFSPNIVKVIKSRRMRWAGHVAHVVEESNVYRILTGRPEGSSSLERPMCRWEDNIKVDLREIMINGVNWIWLACQDSVWWRVL
jgi:hypothetical protein